MKGTIMITSVRKGTKCTAINYLLLDKDYLINNENAKGFVDLVSFTSNDVISNFTSNDFLVVLECSFRQCTDYKNPLNTQLKLEAIKLKNGKVINLL